jgi:hypothetical protein
MQGLIGCIHFKALPLETAMNRLIRVVTGGKLGEKGGLDFS